MYDSVDVLSTSQIAQVLQNCCITAPYFHGVYALDMLPKTFIFPRPALVVVNTAFSGNLEGEHWVAYFLSSNNSLDYFDSYGLPPQGHHMSEFIKQNDVTNNFTYNTTPLQSLDASTCGKYVVTYLYYRVLHYTKDQYVDLLSGNADEKVKIMYRNKFGGGRSCNGGVQGQKCYKYKGVV